MRLEVTLDKLIDHAGKGTGTVFVDEQVACTAELTFAIGD